jgi:hypothetical protein
MGARLETESHEEEARKGPVERSTDGVYLTDTFEKPKPLGNRTDKNAQESRENHNGIRTE